MSRRWRVVQFIGLALIALALWMTWHQGVTWRVPAEHGTGLHLMRQHDPLHWFAGVVPQARWLAEFVDAHQQDVPRERLHAADALHNLWSLALTVLMAVPAFAVLLVGVAHWGLQQRDPWTVPLLLLMLVAVPLWYLLLYVCTWLALLFVPATTGYYAVWLVAGLPVLLASLVLAPAPTYDVVVIIVVIWR